MNEILAQLAGIFIGLSGVAVVIGVALIKRSDRVWHPRVMLGATALAALFLVVYVWRKLLYGTIYYAGPSEWKMPYYFLLFVHTILATANGPLAIWLIYNAVKKRFEIHKTWARWVVPIWLFVAVSGWVINLILARYGNSDGTLRI